jgi:RNA polymerase sigma-70 factor (ECF subfamily)
MEENIKSIWNDFRNELLSYIKKKVNDDYIAEDILQEVFIKIYKSIDKLKDQSKLKAWLYRTTQNTIIDFYRRKQCILELDKLENVPIIQYSEDNMNEEVEECVRHMLHQLPDKYKQPLKLYEFNKMKHGEISQKLNLSLSGSKTRVQRARNQLKKMLLECCEFELDAYGNIIDYKRKK